MKYLKFILVLLIFTLLFSPLDALAQPTGLGIFPPIITIRTTPGTQIKQPIRVFNYLPTQIYVTTQIIPFTQITPNGQPILNPNTKPPAWIKITGPININQQAHPIPPNQYQDFLLTLTPPANTPIQDIYFTVLFKQKTSPSQTKLTISHQIGTNILLNLTHSTQPPPTPNIIFSYLKIPSFLNPFTKNIPLQIQIYNQSDFWTQILPVIKLQKTFGLGSNQTLTLVPVNIIGGNKRWIHLTEENIELALYNNKLQTETNTKNSPLKRIKNFIFSKQNKQSANNIVFSSDSFKLGLYQWQIEIYDDNGLNTTHTQWVVFFPWWILVLIPILIIIKIRLKN